LSIALPDPERTPSFPTRGNPLAVDGREPVITESVWE
jgi:hypothetical protein